MSKPKNLNVLNHIFQKLLRNLALKKERNRSPLNIQLIKLRR
jgi:hypothetical protein